MKGPLAQLFKTSADLPYVGEKTYQALQRLNCSRIIDLVFHLPYDLETWNATSDVSKVANKSQITTKLKIIDLSERRTRTGKRIISLLGQDEHNNFVYLTYFNFAPYYILNKVEVGKEYVVSGKIEQLSAGEFQIAHPEFNLTYKPPKTVEAKYHLTYAITSKQIASLAKYAIAMIPSMPEWLDEKILQRHHWLSFTKSLELLHSPKHINDISANSPYRKRIAFDELLASQIALKLIRQNKESYKKGQAIIIRHQLREQLLHRLGFTLTDGQHKALQEIEKDQTSSIRMMRLLQGDVGSGKTLVALCAMLNAVENGMQAVLMAPTDILARQHYEWFKEVLGDFVQIELLTGGAKKRSRDKILQELSSNQINILIGTHAVFQPDVMFAALQLVIIDEQHRFGVEQRLSLMDKGKNCDVLVMSATPIPRTLALTAYGDMDVSVISDKPQGRMPIQTSTIALKRIDEVIEAIKRKIAQDERVFWVCPMIEVAEDSEDNPDSKVQMAAAIDRYHYICQQIDANMVGLIHGKLVPAEKEQVMNDFATGKTKILVATTVIEVGINVPEATLLVVENAERFGLAQLHQLRGRVGRGHLKSDCILLFGDKLSETARTRLKTMRESNDGFYIAEQDLVLRGGGDILGHKQSGVPEFLVADLEFDRDLLLQVHQLAGEILQEDGKLCTEKYKTLRYLLAIFDYDQHLNFLFAG